MKATAFSLLIMFSLMVSTWAISSEVNNMEKNDALNQRQQDIIPIAAFTAAGEINRLKPALGKGLDDGLTVNEIKEILVHLYAYAGFPRSLNVTHQGKRYATIWATVSGWVLVTCTCSSRRKLRGSRGVGGTHAIC